VEEAHPANMLAAVEPTKTLMQTAAVTVPGLDLGYAENQAVLSRVHLKPEQWDIAVDDDDDYYSTHATRKPSKDFSTQTGA